MGLHHEKRAVKILMLGVPREPLTSRGTKFRVRRSTSTDMELVMIDAVWEGGDSAIAAIGYLFFDENAVILK